jgi:3-methyladenine DNA glycosylase/8-oxoguanine DNA glycosylase
MGRLAQAPSVIEQDARPSGPHRLPGAGRDGVLRRRDGCLTRLLHHGEEPVTVRAWPVADAIRLRAEASTREAAAHGVRRMRFALGVDHDLAPFFRHVKRDRLLGPIVRRIPWIRPMRRAEPFEALAWAITEQLIETERAFGIQRRLTWRYGRRSACGTLRDVPSPAALAARAPAELASCDLAPKRAIALIKVAREVASGRADLGTHEPAWRRLRAIPEIGSWTVEKLAFEGQGRDDQLPAGDLAYVKLVGRLAGLGRRASEDEVREFFEPYAPFQGLAGIYLLAGRRFALAGRPPIFATARA